MDEKIRKLGPVREIHPTEKPAVADVSLEHGEVKEAAKNIVDVVETGGEDEGTGFKEKEGQDQAQSGSSAASTAQNTTAIAVMPPIEEMIKQTVAAIELELQKTKEEMNILLKDKAASPYTINDKVKRIRFLNGLIADLKRAAKMAEEYIVGLWKQYVKKSG
jgi:hypothetical protein